MDSTIMSAKNTQGMNLGSPHDSLLLVCELQQVVAVTIVVQVFS